jgi:hypothetical protein
VAEPAENPVVARTRRFYEWELRGRGWLTSPYRVELEPPFRPFPGHEPPRREAIDDARRPTFLSALVEQFTRRALPVEATSEEVEEPSARPAGEAPWREHLVTLPTGSRVGAEAVGAWLGSLATLSAPVSFELVGHAGRVWMALVTAPEDETAVFGTLRAFFPDAVASASPWPLERVWRGAEGEAVVVEWGLAREFMLPLSRTSRFNPDPLAAVLSSLAAAGEGETAVLQVLFKRAAAPWAESVSRAVVTPRGEPFFADAPEVTKLAHEKLSSPFFAAVVRIGAHAASSDRAWRLLRPLAGALDLFTGANELVPLATEDEEALEEDLLERATHRSGFLLSAAELVSLVHLPSEAVAMPELVRRQARTKSTPAETAGDGVLLGRNDHEGKVADVRLPEDIRLKHLYVVGASGTGKSTLLVSLILADIERGAGVAVLDPHGDLVDEVASRLPARRLRDAVLFDPADEASLVGWNILATEDEVERDLLAGDLVSVFRRLSTSWGDQMTAVLTNAVMAFLDSSRGGTLLDLRRFLVDAAFRRDFLSTVRDPYVASFWREEFPLLYGKPQGPILTRLDTLLRSRLVRRVVTATGEPVDFRRLVEEGGIFLGRLSQGAIGQENAAVLGSLLVSKFHQVALLRQGQEAERRRPFFLYLDEFHDLATPSMASLFSGARKYRLGVAVAHQDLYQLHAQVPEVERAVLANAYTRIVFRLNESDAKTLTEGFSYFEPADLTALGTGEAIARVGGRASDFNLRTLPLPVLGHEEARRRRERLREEMRERFPPPAVEEEPQAPDERLLPEAPPSEPRPAPSAAEPPYPLPKPRSQLKETTPGRGGAEHKYLQELVRSWGQERGLLSTVEKAVLEGVGSVDVALERQGYRLAVEIAMTTSTEHEVANVRKCLESGFDEVAVVSLKRRALSRVEAALREFPDEERSRVFLLSPEELLTHIDSRRAPEEKTVAGYRVKVRHVPGKDPDQARREVARVIAKSLERLGRRED